MRRREEMMRRSEKEISEKAAIEDVIRRSVVCRLGLCEGDRPYIVPLCFGYRDGALYIHGSSKGKKMDILKKNLNVCFEFDLDCKAVEGKTACEWGMQYRSVIGFGKARIVEDPSEKQEALSIIMRQYSGGGFDIPEKIVTVTTVIKVEIESMTGKQSGFGK